MNIFLPLIPPFLIGFLGILLALKPIQLQHKKLLIASLAIPIGFGIISILLFLVYALGSSYAIFIGIGLICVITVLLITVSALQVKTLPKWSLLNIKSIRWIQLFVNSAFLLFFIYCTWHCLEYFAAETTYNPFGGWDARYMWNIKARFYTRIPEFWSDQFFHPKPWWTLPDYPHLLPGSVAWGWLVLGRESLGWPAIVGLAFLLSLTGLSIWFVLQRYSFRTALLFGAFLISIPTYQFWSAAQYADIPLCFFITSASVFSIESIRRSNPRLALCAGLLTGLAAWTKNEGILFLMMNSFLFTISSVCILKKNRKQIFTSYLVGTLPAILMVIYLKTQLGGAGIYLGSPRTISDYLKLISDPNRILLILAAFFAFLQTPDWLYLWKITGALLMAGLFGFAIKIRKLTFEIVYLLCSVFLILGGYLFIYLITPIELKFHIQYTMTRLLLHVGILMLFATTSLFGAKAQN